jgi:hypothetical protein
MNKDDTTTAGVVNYEDTNLIIGSNERPLNTPEEDIAQKSIILSEEKKQMKQQIEKILLNYECSICCDTIAYTTCLQSCGDCFCYACISDWATRNAKPTLSAVGLTVNSKKALCPLCQIEFQIESSVSIKLMDNAIQELLVASNIDLEYWESRCKEGKEKRRQDELIWTNKSSKGEIISTSAVGTATNARATATTATAITATAISMAKTNDTHVESKNIHTRVNEIIDLYRSDSHHNNLNNNINNKLLATDSNKKRPRTIVNSFFATASINNNSNSSSSSSSNNNNYGGFGGGGSNSNNNSHSVTNRVFDVSNSHSLIDSSTKDIKKPRVVVEL